MRIVAGMWRGRGIGEPTGRAVTRPTTDRVREAMASMVASARDEGIEGAVVLDAFAGSGAPPSRRFSTSTAVRRHSCAKTSSSWDARATAIA